MSLLPSSSSSSSLSRHKYDVFLSFRGEDTRKSFTDHLYAALKRNGITTFRDDPKLKAGQGIAPELFKAIQESWCSVIIISETYAFSHWCLDELAEILKQRNERGHKIFPIFYDVNPSDLRKQTGRVEEAFVKHDDKYKDCKDKTRRWRTALAEVANLKGWHLNDRHESEFIGDIVKRISAKLCQTYSIVHDDHLIGTDSRLEELYSKIEIGEDDVRIIGICGMGGIGKTTLARVVYNQMSPHFEGKSFLADVREVSQKRGLVSLQRQLLSQVLLEEDFSLFDIHEGNVTISHRLSHKKVLLVIDDVDNIQHLKCLIGRRDWFGLGSRIIVTTRDEHLLRSYRVDGVYKPTTLNDSEAHRLFSLKAFNSDKVPENEFIQLSKGVVEYADGLPLALEVLSSFFFGRDATQWRSAIERLKRDAHREIHDRLQISFDGLEETEKNIFLDIACFFKGEDKDFVLKVLDGCEFFPNIGIDVLIKKSLITIDENSILGMHDLLQEMGKKIVREKCVDEPGKRCRLWEKRDVYHVLTKHTATEVLEGMVIDNKRQQNKTFTLSADAFSKMKKLRLLKVLSLPNSQDIKYLSNELRLFEWHGYPLKFLPSSFEPDNLVALFLPCSYIEQLWKENRAIWAAQKSTLDMLIPGSEIPKWMNHQTDESSIKIALPPNDSQWFGVCLSFVFVSDDNDALGEEAIEYKAVIHSNNSPQAEFLGFLSRRSFTRQQLVKDHLWLHYSSREKIFPFSSEEIGLENQECYEIELTIGMVSSKVKRCGFKILYEKDYEETEQCIKQLSSNLSSAANFDDIRQDTTASAAHTLTGVNASLLKRKHNTIYEEEEEEEAGPKPKRLQKILEFMMGKKH